MKTGTSSSSPQLQSAVQLPHKATQLQQEDATPFKEDWNAHEVKRAVQFVCSAPEINAERIENLRAQIQGGIYQINNETLARKILGIVSLQI